jgi:hypothetical protein
MAGCGTQPLFDVEETLGHAVSVACYRRLNVSIAADLFREGNMHMHRNTAAARTGGTNRHLDAALACVAMALLFIPCSLAAERRTARPSYSAQIFQITPVPGICTRGPLPAPTKCVSEPLSRTAP